MTDHVKDQLCQRIEELEKEKLELNEQLDIAQREREALAAHVEFCHKVMSMVENGPAYLVARQYRALRLARGRKPETSLARLKAKWQAEALRSEAILLYDSLQHTDEQRAISRRIADILRSKADSLERQAEGEEE